MNGQVSIMAEDQLEQFFDTLSQWDTFKITPFQIISGAYDVVNGAIVDNPNINDETQYKKTFTGQNSSILIWRDSTKLVLKDPEQLAPYAPTDFKKEFKVGIRYEMYVTDVATSLGGADGTIESLSTINCFVAGDILEENLFDAYVIPGLNNFLYKFELGTKYINPDREIVKTEFTLTKINEIGTSDDVNQVFQLGTLGEGYAFPASFVGPDGNEFLYLNQSRLQNRPVASIQIEAEDPIVMMDWYLMGRPLNQGTGQGQTFEEPRLLFPFNFQSTDGNKLSGQISPSDYYLYSNNMSVSIDTYYDDWTNKVLTKYSPESIRNYEGHITDTQAPATNLTNGDGIGGSFGTTYWDDWTFNTTSLEINILSPFAEETFNYDNAITYTMEEMNIANIFRHQHIQKLPMSETQTTPRVSTSIPVLGILGKLIFVGTDSGWYNTDALRNRVGEVGGFINKDYYKLLEIINFIETQEITAMPLDTFGEDKPEAIMGISSMPTIFKSDLTDTFIIDPDQVTEYTTDVLGKDINEDGIPPFLWNLGEYKPVSTRSNGFAIDNAIVQSIGKTKYKLTAYDANGDAFYALQYKSSSSRTGDTRDITTIFNTSAWVSDELIEVPPVVDPIPPDLPETLILENIELPIATTLKFDKDDAISTKNEENTDLVDIVQEFLNVYPSFDIEDYNFIDIEITTSDGINSFKGERQRDGNGWTKTNKITQFNKDEIISLSNIRLDIQSTINVWNIQEDDNVFGEPVKAVSTFDILFKDNDITFTGTSTNQQTPVQSTPDQRVLFTVGTDTYLDETQDLKSVIITKMTVKQ